ncbi:Cellulose binding domain-containing protein [Micromonospora haikouensis]|uniref:Cellulose binding domain-containing protein n=1 Tax=Micromonospora haikouensis TaxID=686309 RepID=A0A1C4Y7G8_9ACTN|nr:cellulose binding domain-containing protein [Micromonospora haikouensis]SCF16566.1 Cellulose binding domain-containing protein [Micromonospora haikouensis]
MGNRKRLALLAVSTAATVTVAAAGVAVAQAAAAGCAVRYAVSSQWSGGFNADVTVTNLGDPLTSWRLTWTYAAGQQATQAWNATVTQSGAQVTATNVAYNGAVATNGTVGFGFTGSWSGANPAPTNFAVNGVTCNGPTTPTTPPPTTTAPPTTPPPTTPPPIGDYPPSGRLCNSTDVIDIGKYWIPNNQWGAGTGAGSQCIWTSGGSGDRISWGTSYNWSGQAGTVKSFAAAILGWHWGWRRQNTGLPVQLSANRNVNTSWQFTVTQIGTVNQNVAYDCWLHPMANPGSADQPSDELMIWLYRSNASPAGSRQGTVTIAGTTWEIWRGYVGTWNVYSYVRTSNTTNANLNIRDFTNDLVARGWMSSSKYLTSVQAGPEIFTGNGQVTTSTYSVTIN